jgi:hypothetical protein
MNMLAISEPAANRPPDDLVGVRACAKQLNLSPSTISRQLAKNLFRNYGTAAAPKVSVTEVEAARSASVSPAQQRQAAPEATAPKRAETGYAHERAVREGINRQRDELALAEKLGTVLNRAEVEDDFETFARTLRERLRQRAQTLVLELDQLPTPAARAARLVEADEAVLAELADELESLAGGAVA